MDVYHLTGKGEALSKSWRSPRVPAWQVIHYLALKGAATRDQLLEYAPSATSSTLETLKRKGIITGGQGVTV